MLAALPYGAASLEIALQADLIQHPGAPELADETAAVCDALRHPIAAPPLAQLVKPGERVAILVNDITRVTRSDLLLPPIVDTLNRAGVPDHDIFIVFALGIHRPQTPAERRLIIGDDLFRRLRNFDHIATDDASLVTLGATRFGNTVEINRHVMDADRIILTGEIMYHLLAGYSGGRKSLMPGVAGWRTTTFNHRMLFDRRCDSGILDGNPIHEDMVEATRMVAPDFLVNVVLAPGGRLSRVVAGDWRQAHLEGCRTVDRHLAVPLHQPYDLLVASAGGYPLDIDLRQAHKALQNACRALKPGGAILFFAECPNGSGHPSFEDYVARYDNDHEMKAALLDDFEIGGHKAFWVARLGRHFDIHLVSSLPPDFVERCHLHPVPLADYPATLARCLARAGPSARVGVMPHAGHLLPRLSGPTTHNPQPTTGPHSEPPKETP